MVPAAGKTTAEKLAVKNGISFYRINSDKFKTTRVDIFFVDSLRRERASGNAILPSIMKRGCTFYPSQRELEMKLEELYGADIDGGVIKKGEMQFISFHMSHISDRYTGKGENLFDECAALLMCLLENPLVEENGFKKELFKQERDNLVDYIRSRVNDKMRFSFSRCVEEMCSGEPYETPEDGTEEDALLLNPRNTLAQYEEMLRAYPAYVYISGEVADGSIQKFMDRFLASGRGQTNKIEPTLIHKDVKQVRHIDESMDVNQGKLCLGFRTHVEPASPDYYPLVVYNGILGGDVHSKLFQNVREKAGLAYYAQSVLEKYKGLMIIMSGIEAEKRSRAQEIILRQVEEIKNGNVAPDEIKATLNSLQTGLRTMQDSQGAIVDFFMSQHITESGEDFDSMSEAFKKVTVEDVVRVAQSIQLDTVYFLKPDGGQVKEGKA